MPLGHVRHTAGVQLAGLFTIMPTLVSFVRYAYQLEAQVLPHMLA